MEQEGNRHSPHSGSTERTEEQQQRNVLRNARTATGEQANATPARVPQMALVFRHPQVNGQRYIESVTHRELQVSINNNNGGSQ